MAIRQLNNVTKCSVINMGHLLLIALPSGEFGSTIGKRGYRKKCWIRSKILDSLMAWLAWVQLNSVFLFSPSQAMSESGVFERIQHFLRYHLLSTVSMCVIVEENSTGDISSIHIVDFSVFLHLQKSSQRRPKRSQLHVQTNYLLQPSSIFFPPK